MVPIIFYPFNTFDTKYFKTFKFLYEDFNNYSYNFVINRKNVCKIKLHIVNKY